MKMRAAMKWPKQITADHVAEMIRSERSVPKALFIFDSATGEYPHGYQHNSDTFGLMIGRLAAAGQFTAAESLLLRMNAEKIQCTEDIFVKLCREYGRAHMPLETLRTFRRMNDFDCKPSEKSYITVFSVLVKENHLKLAYKFHAHMKEMGIKPNVSSCNVLIKALCKNPKTLVRAFRIFGEMPGKGLEPDSFTYSTLIDGLCKHGKLAEAMELFKKMESKGFLDVVAYSSLIHGLCVSGKVDDALILLDQMSAKNVSPNVITYSTVMHGLCKAERSLEALGFLQKMVSKGLSPNMFTYSTLVSGFCMEGKIQDAVEIFDQMKLRGWKPDAPLYRKIINGFCSENRPQEAANLLDEMVLNGVEPNRATRAMHVNVHNTVLQSLCREGDKSSINRAFQVYLGMVNRGIGADFETFNLMVDGFCKRVELSKVARIVGDMLDNGFVPDDFTWTAIVRVVWNRKKVREAALLLQEELTNLKVS